MKLKSLFLGTVAAAGLSTAGFAADLGVLTSLDVCDDLGISGLTISSGEVGSGNCLQISGGVSYEFNWGNYRGAEVIATPIGGVIGSVEIDGPDSLAGSGSNDWESRVQSWLKFVGTQSSDFGPASAVIKLKHDDRVRVRNGIFTDGVDFAGVATGQRETGKAVVIDEAYVQVGDTTVLTAGKRGSIFNKGDDEPFNFPGLFISQRADTGTVVDENDADRFAPKLGGHVVQLWTNVGEGFIAKVGLENLGSEGGYGFQNATLPGATGAEKAGTLVGVLDYAGSGVTAHISGAYGGLLDGETNAGDTYLVHAGATASFDAFKVRAAGSFGGFYNDGAAVGAWSNYWNALISGEANFDMFKIALSAEAARLDDASGRLDDSTDFGFGGSIGANVAEGIAINLGGRYFNDGTDGVGDAYQVALQLVAAVTETMKITGEIGVYGNGTDTVARAPGAGLRGEDTDFYGKAELAWTPGGNFSSSVAATAFENGAYKVTFKAAKTFQ